MITVAKNLDVPIKLKMPFLGKFSILGLGDIVVPGVLASWALKFDTDSYLGMRKLSLSKNMELRFKTPYFLAVVIGYIIGIVLTLISLTVM
jgi:minor histocompatibility antigen H13